MDGDVVRKILRIVLLAGMVLSVSVMITGLIMYSISDGEWEEKVLSPDEIIAGILDGNPIAVIDLGILLLIATPLTRVISTMIIFLYSGEVRFVIIALLVLVVIGIAVISGGI